MNDCLVIPFPGENLLHVCICVCVFMSWLWAQVHPRDMCILPLLYTPQTNDGPSIGPYLKRSNSEMTPHGYRMWDGSAGRHRWAQTNKLELNVQKTIEIQGSHFPRHSSARVIQDIVGGSVTQLLERHHSNKRICLSVWCPDLKGG